MNGAQEIRRAAIALLARREHSAVELERKLAERGHPPAAVREVLGTLGAEGLLSDERFAESYVRTRTEKGVGPVRIQAELRERGVDDEVIAQHLDFSDPAWVMRAAAALRKRFGVREPADFAEHARQVRFLQYRGFTTAQVRTVLRSGGDQE